MDSAMVIGAFRLLGHLSLPVLAAVCVGALVAGIVRVTTQIDDPSLGALGRLSGLAALLLIGSKWWLEDVVRFAARIWGGADTYW